MFCRKCGKEIVEGKKFCSSCGAAIEPLKPKHEEESVDNTETTSFEASDMGIEVNNESENEDEYIFFGNGKNRELIGQIMNLLFKVVGFVVGLKMVKYIFWEDHPAEIKTISSSIIGFLLEFAIFFIVLGIIYEIAKLAEYKASDLKEDCDKTKLLFVEIAELISEIVIFLPFVNPTEYVMAKWGMTIMLEGGLAVLKCFPVSIGAIILGTGIGFIKRKYLVNREPDPEI